MNLPQFKEIVGLDIGTTAIRAIWFKKKGNRLTASRFSSIDIPLEDNKNISEIEKWIKKNKLDKTPCIINFPGYQTIFQPLTLSPNDPRSMKQAAEMEIIRFNEMITEPVIWDVAPLTHLQNEKRLLIAIARKSSVDSSINYARKMGINVIDIVPTSVAIYNALCSLLPEHIPALILGIGESSTDVVIGNRSMLIFARSIGAGGRIFSDAIAKAKNVSKIQGEILKKNSNGLEEKDEIGNLLISTANILIDEIKSVMAVYSRIFPSSELQPLTLIGIGGGSQLKGLMKTIANKLGLTLVDKPNILPFIEDGASFVVSYGLGLSYSLVAETFHLSLLPPSIKTELIFKYQKPYWIATACTALLTIGITLIGGYKDYKKNEKILLEEGLKLKRCAEIADNIEFIEKRNNCLLAMANELQCIMEKNIILPKLIETLSAIIESGDWLTLIADYDSYKKRNKPLVEELKSDKETEVITKPVLNVVNLKMSKPRQMDPSISSPHTIIIEGYTRKKDLTSVKNMISKLLQKEFVLSADLLSDDKVIENPEFPSEWESPRAYRFTIEIKIKSNEN